MPIDPTQFPLLPTTQYGPEELHDYLAYLIAQGQTVYRDDKQTNVFYIVLTDEHRIRISVSKGHSQIQLHYLSNMLQHLNVTSLPDLEKAITQLSSLAPGTTWPNKPTSGRLRTDTPAANYRTIAQLIGKAKITAIFDPYIDNKTLEELRVVLSFGESTIADGIRILGGVKKSEGLSPTFTASGFSAWLVQQGISGEARTFTSTEHRRFILLSDGSTFIAGHSLNAPHKNEAVRIETNTPDQLFFEEIWRHSQPL